MLTSGSDYPNYTKSFPRKVRATCVTLPRKTKEPVAIFMCVPDDTIHWTAKTKEGWQWKMHHHMIIRQEDDILDKAKGGDPIQCSMRGRETSMADRSMIRRATANMSILLFIYDENGPCNSISMIPKS